MTAHRSRRRALALLAALPALPLLSLSGCAISPLADPLRVELAGIDSLPGEGLELRFMLQLRVQNPNDAEIAYDGVAVELDLRGQRFGSGVSPLQGRLPRYGEALLSVPVTVPGLALARQLLGLARAGESLRGAGRVGYALRGKLGLAGGFGAARFEKRGEIDLGAR